MKHFPSYAFTILLFTFVAKNSNAEEPAQLDLIVGLSKPPYIIEELQSGFEIELISHVLSQMKIEPTFLYVPLGRSMNLLDRNVGQALLTVNKNIVADDKHRTEPYVTYQNVAISLAENKIKLTHIKELPKYRVAAFQMANRYLGKAYSRAVKNSQHYLEVPNQFRQVKLFLEKRVDVVVMDINIFNYYLKKIEGELNNTQVDVHYIFPRNPYSLAFKDPKYVTSFNYQLGLFKRSPLYKSLLEKYKLQSQWTAKYFLQHSIKKGRYAAFLNLILNITLLMYSNKQRGVCFAVIDFIFFAIQTLYKQ